MVLAREMVALVGLGRRRARRGPRQRGGPCRCGEPWSRPREATPTPRCRSSGAHPRGRPPSDPGFVTRLDALAVGAGGVAARRRASPQGGPGVPLGRGDVPGQGGRRGRGWPAGARAPRRRPVPAPGRTRRAGGRHRDRPRAAPGPARSSSTSFAPDRGRSADARGDRAGPHGRRPPRRAGTWPSRCGRTDWPSSASSSSSVALLGLVALVALGDVADVAWRWAFTSAAIHIPYLLLLALAYRYGDFSLVYPLARGGGALVAALGGALAAGRPPLGPGLGGHRHRRRRAGVARRARRPRASRA